MPLYPRHGAYFTTYFCNKINKHAGGIFVLCRVEFSKIGKRDFTFIREMRVRGQDKGGEGRVKKCKVFCKLDLLFFIFYILIFIGER